MVIQHDGLMKCYQINPSCLPSNKSIQVIISFSNIPYGRSNLTIYQRNCNDLYKISLIARLEIIAYA